MSGSESFIIVLEDFRFVLGSAYELAKCILRIRVRITVFKFVSAVLIMRCCLYSYDMDKYILYEYIHIYCSVYTVF